MTSNRTPLTGQPLEQPDPEPLRKYAIYDAGQPCGDHHAPFTGRMPYTGVLRCTLCGTCWDPDTGRLLPEAGAS